MTSFSFVIPCYNNWALTHQLLFDICQKCSQVDEVIVVDDGSTEIEVRKGLQWWKDSGILPVKRLELEENCGFIVASNAGLRTATGDIICLISNDVKIFKDLVLLIKAGLSIQDKMLGGGKVYNESTGWNDFNGRIFPYVEGWLLFASKDNWKELGYFDKRYIPNDFEDVDLSTTALSKGYALAQITPDAGDVVKHIGAQTYGYNPERESLTIRNRKKFAEKWGVNA